MEKPIFVKPCHPESKAKDLKNRDSSAFGLRMTYLKFLFIPLFLVLLSSCDKPTYSKEKIKESVIELCKNEYNIDVKVRVTGATLGVFLPVDGLVDPDLKLNESAGKKIEDVALSMHRVIMSTDMPLKFYALTARDTKTPGAEFILTGHAYDIVRVRLMDISRGEYHKRILRDFKFNPVIIGETKIKELFRALNENSQSTENLKSLFYPIYAAGEQNSQKIDVKGITAKEISEQEALFFIETSEYYKPLAGFENYRAVFPQGFNNEYLILVNISVFPDIIREIVPKYFYSGTEIRKRNLRETFDNYKETGYIDIDGLPKKDLTLDWFLSQQIARRIRALFTENKNFKNKFTAAASQGSMNDKIFRFELGISPDNISAEDSALISSEILKLAGTILHRYNFEDFEGVEVIEAKPGGKRIYLSREQLELLRKGEIEIEDITLFEILRPTASE
jgi:hypothetical protein